MPRCGVCGTDVALPFDCPYCGGSFCGEHRLPPSHDCPGAAAWRARERPPAKDGPAAPQPDAGGPQDPIKTPGEGTECFTCGVKTTKTWYCPQCGHDFCSFHRHHADNHTGAGGWQPPWDTGTITVEPGVPGTGAPVPPQPPAPDKPMEPAVVAVFVIAILVVIGAVIAVALVKAPPGPADPGPAPSVSPEPAANGSSQPYATNGAAPDDPACDTLAGYPPGGGHGALSLHNQLEGWDAAASLTRSSQNASFYSFSVRAGEKCMVAGIPDGTYTVSVVAGRNWSAGAWGFSNAGPYRWTPAEVTYRTDITTDRMLAVKRTTLTYWVWYIRISNTTSGSAGSMLSGNAPAPGSTT